MKIVAVFSLILAMATSYPVVRTWTMSQLSSEINAKTDPALLPYVKEALNRIMTAMFVSETKTFEQVALPSPTGDVNWTLEQVVAALEDNATNQPYRPALQEAVDFIQMENATKLVQEPILIMIPAMDISAWTPEDLTEALRSPTTKSFLIPYLEKANTLLKEALEKGEPKQIVYTVTPVGLIAPKADYDYLPKPLKNLIKKTKKGL